MNPYQYKISLGLRHPSVDPADVTSALSLNPSRSWRVGERRTTPKGNPLEGNNRDSRWTTELAEGKWPGKKLSTVIGEHLDQLQPHKDFFHRMRSEGGRTELYVGWFFDGLGGDDFDCDLMARMADLKIDLSLHVYPPDPAYVQLESER